MKRVLAIARLNLLELFRDRGELVAVIVLPLLLTWVFGMAFGSEGAERALEIPVADIDASTYSKAIVAELDAAEAFDVRETSESEARELVEKGDAPVAVIVPEGFGDELESGGTGKIEAIQYPGSQNAQAAAGVLQGAAARVSANVAASRIALGSVAMTTGGGQPAEQRVAFRELYTTADGFWEPAPPVGVVEEAVSATPERQAEQDTPQNTQSSLGFTVFFVFMVALGSAGGVLEDRELGTLRRVLAAPARKAEILGGKVLGVALVAAFEAALLVGFGALVFGVPWGKDPLAIGVLLLALVFAATGLGVMVSALVRTRSQMSAAAPVLSTALAMLGGCYWPIEVTSPTMQTVAKFTPTGWAMVGLKDVVARGLGLEAVLVPVAVLAAFSAITIAIGIARLRLE